MAVWKGFLLARIGHALTNSPLANQLREKMESKAVGNTRVVRVSHTK